MPEIIEVRKYADFIIRLMKNHTITEINIINGRYKKHRPFKGYYSLKSNLPLKITNVETRGKLMYIQFGDLYMISTLGLSGGWCFINDNKIRFPTIIRHTDKGLIQKYHNKAKKHINVQFKTSYGSLYFFDMLSFGTLKVVNKDELDKKLNKLGPDIMDSSFEQFYTSITKTNNLDKKIGIVLMDQKTVAGVGNYLRADTLWMSKINPFRKVKSLSEKEIKKIYSNVRALTWGNYNYNYAVKHKIITNQKIPEDYNLDFFIYRSDKDIYGNKIIKELLYEGSQKRYIYWVPKLQK